MDVWFSDPNKIFKTTDTAVTYRLEEFELLYDALSSPSLDKFYSSNNVQFHGTEYEHVYSEIPTGTTTVNLQLPSNRSNCAGTLTIVRPASNIADTTVQKLEDGFYSMSNFKETDMRVNTKSIYMEEREKADEWYKELSHLFPEVDESKHFDPEQFYGGQFMLASNLSGAPSQFHKRLLSGVRTSLLTTDLSQEIEFSAPTTTALRVDTYVVSDVIYSYSKGRMQVLL